MTPELIVFDFDGVLVDSEVISNEVVAAALTELDYPVSVADCHRRFTGLKLETIRAQIEAEQGRPLSPRLEALVRDETYRRLDGELQMVRGADALLRGLQGPRCIASNSSPRWIELGLRATGLEPFFQPEIRFSAAHVAHGKPAPDVFIHAATSMGTEPAACLVIEDSVHGVAGAVAAGMRVIGFAGASHIPDGHEGILRDAGAETVFDDLTQLPGLLRRLS
jgi:HAD superfamily hydrolase (TIGR01509 family)